MRLSVISHYRHVSTAVAVIIRVLYDHPLYLACPDMLSLVGEILSGDGWGSSNLHSISYFIFLLMIYLFI
jgi:hypothetical protein